MENQTLNEQLEHRVAKRTAQLANANEKLQKSMQQIETTMDQLVQSEKLASLGSMVAGIAHELNTPIVNRMVVGALKGEITLSSAVGSGTQFTLSLPVELTEQDAPASEQAMVERS